MFDGADAVVNLCGAGVGDHRWNQDYKRLLLSSRVNPTRLLAVGMRPARYPGHAQRLRASGYYGPHGDGDRHRGLPRPATPSSARLCVAMGGGHPGRPEADVRVVNLRTGLVLGKDGGLLPKLTLLTRLMLGGKLGSGKQYFPWISVTDEIAAMVHLLTAPVHGPVNLTGPYPVTNAEFTKELGEALHRPAPWIVPGFALHWCLGEFADEVLTGQRALPVKLHDSGFEFTHRTLPEALAAELG